MLPHAPHRRSLHLGSLITTLLVVHAMTSAWAFASPSTTGQWSTVYSWPDVAIHMSVLPDGRVLTYADDDNPMYTVNGTRLAGSTKTYVIDIPSMGVPGAVTGLPQT